MSYGNGGQFSFPSVSYGMSNEDLINLVARMQKELNWLLNNLDSANVTRINTNLTQIQSENGKTIIEGPLLQMYDESGILRLKQGYDESSGNFVFELLDGTITGGMLRTAVTGPRIEIANNRLSSLNALNQKEGFCIEDYSGIYAGLMYHGNAIIGGLVIDSGLTLYSNTLSSQPLNIKSGKHMYIQSIDELGVIYIGGGSTAAVDFSGSNVLGLDDSGYATREWVSENFAPL